MDDDCTMACCVVTPRRTVSELFDRGLRRSRQAPLAVQGETRRDANGFTASFSLTIDEGTLGKIGFKATTCITLVAYCELIAELSAGQDIAQAARLAPADLVAELPNVPALKRDRAPLAIAAFRDALAAASMSSSQSVQGEHHESRLHLRHAAP